MANEATTIITGNLTADPELRFTQSGIAVASFTVASTPRIMRDGEWEDGEPLFMRCSVWRQQAEHLAESLTRGSRVIVHGKLSQRTWDDKEGNERTTIELEVFEMGASLMFAEVSVLKAERKAEPDPEPEPAAKRTTTARRGTSRQRASAK